MLCLLCNKHQAVKLAPYGFLPCKTCQRKQKKIGKSGQPVEMTSSTIKEERMKYQKDIIQSFREGQLSKEFVETYPEKVKQMVQEGHVSSNEVKMAKNVWSDLSYYKKGD